MNTESNDVDAITTQISDNGFAELLALGGEPGEVTAEDLEEQWGDLLSLPLNSVINQMPANSAAPLREQWKQIRGGTSSLQATRTFGDLISGSPTELVGLRFAKDFGKALEETDQRRWPKPLSFALYFAAYARGLNETSQRIGGACTADLRAGFQHHGDCSWIQKEMREQFQEAKSLLKD